ncbi:MAG: amidohydrolase family protein [Anaerolineae bacterium]|nr:amidohydrolase family protein [Gemmatimonadaceae bacterium]
MRYLTFALVAVTATSNPSAAQTPGSDTSEARRVFEANIDAIHKRDRERYLSYYLQTDALARNGPGGLELGFANWPARRDSTWPDTLIARDLRLVSIAPGVVYGTYHYRVTQAGETSEGISERVFVKKSGGWKIGVSTAFGLPDGAAPPPVALVGGTLINPGKRAVSDAVVVVRGGRVVCAAARAHCTPPQNAETVDASGMFITPGFVDAHVHYSQTGWVDGRPDAFDARAQFPYDSVVAALQERPDRFNRAYLCSGVTSVFDVGGYPWTLSLQKRQELQLHSPRVVASGPLLATIDHWVNTASMRQFLHMKDDSSVRASIRSLARLGSSAIKVWYLQLPDSAQPAARALLMAAGEEAKRAKLPLIVHATQLARAKDALQAGATVLVHSVAPELVDAEFIALAKRNGTIVIPTLTVLEGYLDVAEGRSPAERYPLECVDAATRANLERMLPDKDRSARAARTRQREKSVSEATVANIRRMREAGIPIAMGTDAGNPGTVHGPSVFREMEALQAAGMPAAEVLVASTVVAARAMRRDDIGILEPGKLADLVILEADPTTDIANARRIRMVMKGGALYGRRELLPALKQ